METKTDAPTWMIHLFVRDAAAPSGVRWVTQDEYANLGAAEGLPKRGARFMPGPDGVGGRLVNFKRQKVLPYGQPAGGRRIHGHGYVVRCSARQLTTADIAAAIDYGYFWLWDTEPRRVRPAVTAPDDLEACVRIHSTWYLDNGTLRWIVKPHPDIAPGSVVQGMPLAGRGDRMISRSGTYYASSDVEHVLKHGRFPWMHDWE